MKRRIRVAYYAVKDGGASIALMLVFIPVFAVTLAFTAFEKWLDSD